MTNKSLEEYRKKVVEELAVHYNVYWEISEEFVIIGYSVKLEAYSVAQNIATIFGYKEM